MNILFAYPTMLHPCRGGVERVTDILARELSRRGHRLFYLNNKKDEALAGYDYPADVEFFPYVDYRDARNKDFYIDYLRRNHIDIVINQCGAFTDSTLYCHRADVPVKVISVVHSIPFLNYRNLYHEVARLKNDSLTEKFKRLARIAIYPKIKKDYYRRLQNHYSWLAADDRTDKIVLLSRAFVSDLEQLGGVAAVRKATVIGNPTSYAVERNLPKEKIVLFVGRLTQGEKRPDRLLDVWKRVSANHADWQCVFVGDGPERNRLERAARNLCNVSFVGFQDPEDFYRRASVLCMTSNFEGWGMVLCEMMSKGGVPLAFSSFASVHDIIKDARQLVTPFSIAEYSRKLSAIMDSPELFTELQTKGYQAVEEFSIARVVDKWEALFGELQEE